MKKLLLFLSLSLLILPAETQFRANMYFTSMGKDHVFKVYSADAGYRYEFNEDGQANQKLFTVWTSDEHDFPVKIINHIEGSVESTMEIREIEPWSTDPNYFEEPNGYQVMEMPSM
jgi:hypothetical protein